YSSRNLSLRITIQNLKTNRRQTKWLVNKVKPLRALWCKVMIWLHAHATGADGPRQWGHIHTNENCIISAATFADKPVQHARAATGADRGKYPIWVDQRRSGAQCFYQKNPGREQQR